MGLFGDSNEEENTANVNNNVIIGHTVDVESGEIYFLLIIIAIIKVVELLHLIYKTILKKARKANFMYPNPVSVVSSVPTATPHLK